MKKTESLNPQNKKGEKGNNNLKENLGKVGLGAAMGVAGAAGYDAMKGAVRSDDDDDQTSHSDEAVAVTEESAENVAAEDVREVRPEDIKAEEAQPQVVVPPAHDRIREDMAENVTPEPARHEDASHPDQADENHPHHRQESSQSSETSHSPEQTHPNDPDVVEPVNPDQIAEAIISEEMIDPNDIDANATISHFEEVGVIRTIEGENLTVASFEDAMGNHLVMVDVDGDDSFDVVTDENLNPLATNVQGVTLEDIEVSAYEDNTYLAHNPDDHIEDHGIEDLPDDIIIT